jgi:hypothetical protein
MDNPNGSAPIDRLPPDSLVKLLDSARGEIRAYRTLYFSIMALSIIAPNLILSLQKEITPTIIEEAANNRSGAVLLALNAAKKIYWLPEALWVIGVSFLFYGLSRVVPKFGSGSEERLIAEDIDSLLDPASTKEAQDLLSSAIRHTQMIQQRISTATGLFQSGLLFVIVAVVTEVAIAFITRYLLP